MCTGERGIKRKAWLLVQFQSGKAGRWMREELRTGGKPGMSGREGKTLSREYVFKL